MTGLCRFAPVGMTDLCREFAGQDTKAMCLDWVQEGGGGTGKSRLQNKTPQTLVRVLGRSSNSPPPSTAQRQGKTRDDLWEWHRRAIGGHERGGGPQSPSACGQSAGTRHWREGLQAFRVKYSRAPG